MSSTQSPTISTASLAESSSVDSTMNETTMTTTMPSTSTTSAGSLNPIDPHVDFFLSQKCGNEDSDSGLGFWTWCSTQEERNKVYETKCTGIEGSAAVSCDARLQFIDSTQLRYYTRCPIPGKPPEWKEHTAKLTEAQYNQIVDYCQQTLKSFNSLPLWLILIIVLMVIAAVTTTALLFWRYWLRKRLYPAEYGLASSMDSRFTSGISSTSSMGSTAPASGSALPKLSLRSSPGSNKSPSNLSTKRSSSPGSENRDYAGQRVISLAPSSRRAASRVASRATSSSPVSGANRSVGSISSQGSHRSHRSHSSRSKSGSRSDKGKSSAVKLPISSPSASQGASSSSPIKLGSSSAANPNPGQYQSSTPTSTAMSRQL